MLQSNFLLLSLLIVCVTVSGNMYKLGHTIPQKNQQKPLH